MTTQAVNIYTNKIAIPLKLDNMLINVDWKIIKNNQIKKSYCLIKKKMKINVNLYHHTPSWDLKRSHEDLYDLHKTLFGYHKKVRKQRFTSTLTFCPGSGQEGLIIPNKLFKKNKKQRKAVIIPKRVNIKFRYNLDFCLCVKIVKIWNQHDVCTFCEVCKGS